MASVALPPSAIASSSSNVVVASGSTVHLVSGDKVTAATSVEDAKAEVAGVIRKVAISADGKYAVTAGDDKSLRVWELQDTPKLVSTRSTTKRVADMCFDADNNILVTDKVGDVFRYPFDPRPVESRPQAFVVASDPSLNPDADLILGHVSLICQTVLTYDGKHILTADRDEHIRVSRYPKAYVIDRYLWGSEGFVSSIHIPESRQNIVISGGGEPTLQVFDWTTGALLNRINILSAVEPYRSVRPPTRKIKNRRKAAGASSLPPSSDDPTNPGFFTPPEGHMYPVGQGICISQIDSIKVGDATVVLFYSRGASALHSFVLAEDGSASEISTLPLPHPVLGFARVQGEEKKVIVTLDNLQKCKNAEGASDSEKSIVVAAIGSDAKLSDASAEDSALVSALASSISDSARQVPSADAERLNLYSDLQILPRWPGFEEDEELAGSNEGNKGLPSNVDELAPKRLGRLKAQGHDVQIPTKKRKKNKSERKRARGRSSGKEDSAATGAEEDGEEESALNA